MSSSPAEGTSRLHRSPNEPLRQQRTGALAGWLGTVAGVAATVVILDQVAKYVVSAWIGPETARDRVPIVGDALALEYVENTGAAFGVMAGRTWLLAFLAVAVSVFLVTTWRKSLPDNPRMQVGVGLVLGGASGNLIDRLRLGYVIDFIAVGPWPRFNLADSAITVGLAILFLAVLKDDGDGRTTH